jgi:hypothetical protein
MAKFAVVRDAEITGSATKKICVSFKKPIAISMTSVAVRGVDRKRKS